MDTNKYINAMKFDLNWGSLGSSVIYAQASFNPTSTKLIIEISE